MSQAPKTTTRRKYDADFKAEVLKMLDSGQTAAYVAVPPEKEISITWPSGSHSKR